MAAGVSPFKRVCSHCGAKGAVRLGYCDVCEGPVCDHCGNTQHILGEKRVIHDSCLRDAGDGMFKMIRFIR